MSAGACRQRGLQPGHPDSRAGAQTVATVNPMRWAQSVLRNCQPSQGQRSWPTINTLPWHPSRHTSPRNAICTPTHSIPNPHPSMPPCPPAYFAHPTESTKLDENILLTIANASQLTLRIVSQHITTHILLCPHNQDLFCLCLFDCPSSPLCTLC